MGRAGNLPSPARHAVSQLATYAKKLAVTDMVLSDGTQHNIPILGRVYVRISGRIACTEKCFSGVVAGRIFRIHFFRHDVRRADVAIS